MKRFFTTSFAISAVFALVAAILISCSSAPSPKTASEAHNTRPPEDIVREHLRAVEAGDWTKEIGRASWRERVWSDV